MQIPTSLKNQLQKEKNRVREDETKRGSAVLSGDSEKDFPLAVLSSDDIESLPSNYMPIAETWYDALSIDMVLKASYKRYHIAPLGAYNFFVEPNNRDDVAIVNAIEIGGQYSCVADYFSDSPRLRKSSSPFTSIRVVDDTAQTLWDELADHLNKDEVSIKILYPYNVSSSKWVVGEIEVHKKGNEYQLKFTALDPYGCITISYSECNQLNAVFAENIKKIDRHARFAKPVCTMVPQQRLLHVNDDFSSSILVIEILLSRTIGKHFTELQGLCATELRQIHIECIMAACNREDPRRKRFLTKYAQTCRILPKQDNKDKKFSFNYTNDYELDLNSEQSQSLVLHLMDFQTPNVMKINELVAFFAAETGNVLLMQALLGIDYSEKDELMEDLAENNMFALKEDEYQKLYEIEVLKAQIEAVNKFQKKPEHLQKKQELKIELGAIAEQKACEIIHGLGVFFDARPFAYFRGKKYVFKDYSPLKRENILNDFKRKLLTKKTDLQVDFSRWQYDFNTIKEKLETQRISAEEAHSKIHDRKQAINMDWCTCHLKKEKAVKMQIELIIRVLRNRLDKLPNYYPHDEQGLFEYLFAAKVPVNSRDQANNTLLHIAYARGHLGVVRVLLSRGAKIEAINNNGLTPAQCANKDPKNLIFLAQQIRVSSRSESNFLRELSAFERRYQLHLQGEFWWKQIAIIGWFLNNLILSNRQIMVQKLKDYIEIARIEGDDTQLIQYLRNELKIHQEANGRDTGLFGNSMFFAGLDELIRRVQSNEENYNYVRLTTNAERGMLELRLDQAEKNEKDSANMLKAAETALETEKQKRAHDKERFDYVLRVSKAEMERRQKEQEQKHSDEMKEQETKFTSLIQEQGQKHSEDMTAMEARIMAKITKQQKGEKEPVSEQKSGMAGVASEHGIFAPAPVRSASVNTF